MDRHLAIGVEWAQEIERQVRASDAVIPLLSEASIQSEMLEYELQTAHQAAQVQGGKPRILPVRVGYTGPLPDPLAAILDPLHYILWQGPQDDAQLVADLVHALRNPPKPALPLEPVGGAVPLESEFYITRPVDGQFLDASTRRDSIVVQGVEDSGQWTGERTGVGDPDRQQARFTPLLLRHFVSLGHFVLEHFASDRRFGHQGDHGLGSTNR